MQTVIDTELAYIDTHHPDFIGNVKLVYFSFLKLLI